MKRPLFIDIIPKHFRRRGCWVASTILIRAILNVMGLAMLLPVLILILDNDNIHTNKYLDWVYCTLGFGDDRSFIITLCVSVVVLIALKCLANLLLYRTERNYIYDLYAHMSRRLYIKYHSGGLGFIKHSNSAMLARNVNVVCMIFVTGILKPMAAIASDVILLVMIFAAIVIYDPMVSLLAVAVFVPAVWVYYRIVRSRLSRYGQQENKAQREKARTVIETFRGYPDLEINNAFPSMLRSFDEQTKEIIDVGAKKSTVSTLPQMFTETGIAIGMVMLVLISMGGKSEEVKVMFGIFAVAALKLMPSVRNIMSGWTAIKYNSYTIDILKDAELGNGDMTYESSNSRFGFKKEIEIRGLSFRFDDQKGNKEIINNLSFTIRKGEHIGISGTSGAGKTTLFNLLLGFYTPTGGEILIDGRPLTPADRRAWQNSIGYVSQNVFITDGTFAANVALGSKDEEIDRLRIVKVLEAAKLKDLIDTLPNGIDTPIGEAGCRLSGGQRQRIGIARALYKNADILFFDEATSSLDNRTEEEINKSIEELSTDNKELTIVVIAHRESSLHYCDRIITLEK